MCISSMMWKQEKKTAWNRFKSEADPCVATVDSTSSMKRYDHTDDTSDTTAKALVQYKDWLGWCQCSLTEIV